MRKIEQAMWCAINSGLDWKRDNTEVIHKDDIAKVYLHGNHIASVRGVVYVNIDTLRKWPTPTTKSRLRALGVDVSTRKGVTYLKGVAI